MNGCGVMIGRELHLSTGPKPEQPDAPGLWKPGHPLIDPSGIPLGDERTLLRRTREAFGYRCKQCGHSEATPEGLGAHYRRHHPVVFKDTGGLLLSGDPSWKEARMGTNPIENVVKCEKCDREFTTHGRMRMHMAKAHREKGAEKKKEKAVKPKAVAVACTRTAEEIVKDSVWHLRAALNQKIERCQAALKAMDDLELCGVVEK